MAAFSYTWTNEQWKNAYNTHLEYAKRTSAITVTPEEYAKSKTIKTYQDIRATKHAEYVKELPAYNDERSTKSLEYDTLYGSDADKYPEEEYAAMRDSWVDKQLFTENAKSVASASIIPDGTTGTVDPASKATDAPATASSEARPTSTKASAKGENVFFGDVMVLLEGVQVPVSGVTVSYGLNNLPACSIQLPASSIIRDLTEDTKIHVFVRDFVDDKWKLLFDGELSGSGYSVVAEGATMSLTAIHSCAYPALMSLMQLDIKDFWNNKSSRISGAATIPTFQGYGRTHLSVLDGIMKQQQKSQMYKSMADIVAMLLRCAMQESGGSAVGKWYAKKLGDKPGGWKILKRFFGVSPAVATGPLPDRMDNSSTGGSSSSSGGGGGGVSSPVGKPGQWGDTGLGEKTGETAWKPEEYGGKPAATNLYSQNGRLETTNPATQAAAKDLAAAWDSNDPLLVTSGYRGDSATHGTGRKIDVCSSAFENDLAARERFIKLAVSKGWRVGNEYNSANAYGAPHFDLEWCGE